MTVWILETCDGWEFCVTTWSSYDKAYEALTEWVDDEFEIKENIIEPENYEYSFFYKTGGTTDLWATIAQHIIDKN
jgi:hypothetical protein